MSHLVMMFAVIVGAALQAAVPALAWAGFTPLPVLLGVVLYYALLREQSLMVACAIIAGLLEDSLGLTPLGYTSFAYCAAGFAAVSFRETVMVRQWTTHAVFGGLANAAVTLLVFLLLAKDSLVAIGPVWLLIKLFGALVLGAAVIPLAVALMATLERLLGNVDLREA